MSFLLRPWHILLICLSGWINRRQQETIEYLQAENQILEQKLWKKRISLNDAQRRRLAIKGKVLGRKVLQEIGSLFTPDTILRWHRELVDQKWEYSNERKTPRRPRIGEEIVHRVIQIAQENPTWGYDRIQGALTNLGYQISASTVQNILKDHGIEPAPHRKKQTTWKAFLAMHWDVLPAMDFATIEVWTKHGLETFSLLFVLEQSTRKVQLAGPKCLRLPPKSPNLNPHLERFIRSLKEECLDRKIFFGEKSLRTALSEYLSNYHQERNHQGVGNSILEPGVEAGRGIGPVKCREHLSGILRYYYREAA